MKSTIYTALGAIALITLTTAPVSAETRASIKTNVRVSASSTATIRSEAHDFKEIKREGRSNAAEIRATTTASSTAVRAALKENRQHVFEAMKVNKEELKSAIETRKSELMDRVKNMISEKKKRLESKSVEKVTNRLTKIFNELSDKISRLDSVDAKVATRMNDATTAGANISSTTSLYLEAQTSLTKTKADVEAAHATALAQVATTTSKEVISDLLRVAKESIQSTAQAYRKVVKSLRAEYPQGQASTSIKSEI